MEEAVGSRAYSPDTFGGVPDLSQPRVLRPQEERTGPPLPRPPAVAGRVQ